MKTFRSLFMILLTASTVGAFAAEQVEGTYNGMTFTASINQQVSADITWHDNGEQMHLTYTSRPDPAPRCMCEVYQSGNRQLIIERYFGTQQISNVIYLKHQAVAQPAYEYLNLDLDGQTYKVGLASDLTVAYILLPTTGSLGKWAQLSYNAELSSHYRCICRIYGLKDNGIPLLFVESLPGGNKTAKLIRN